VRWNSADHSLVLVLVLVQIHVGVCIHVHELFPLRSADRRL
jgi:hypothetical protein